MAVHPAGGQGTGGRKLEEIEHTCGTELAGS